MKLRNLLLTATTARLTYLAVTHRKKILSEAKESQELLQKMETNKQHIQEQLALISSYRQPLQEMARDLQYTFRVYQQSIEGNINQIQEIKEKYHPAEESAT